jgi:hypothetical protein
VQLGRDQPFDFEDMARPRSYQRTYWVIAANAKEARRIVRDLEPSDASVRFEGDANMIEELQNVDQAIIERTPALPVE